jgi:nucleotide-binding universal stress UspA family protein
VYVRRVIVGVNGSPGSLLALRYAAAMAKTNDAMLMPVLAWTPPGGEIADRRYPCAPLRSAWKQAATDRLGRAVELALGGPPDDVDFQPCVVQCDAGEALTRMASEPGDVLVIGAGRHGVMRRVACHVARYCLGHGACPVVAVPPAGLAAQAHGLRGWVDRRRQQPADPALRPAA